MDKKSDDPPSWAERLLAAATPPGDREALLGDLAEGYRDRLRSRGPAAGRRWLRRQVLRTLIPGLRRPRRRPRPAARGPGGAHHPHGDGPMTPLLQDLKHSLRTLVRSPAFTVITAGTLALAIGVNSAIFSLVSTLVLDDLPIKEAETLAVVRMEHPGRGVRRQHLSLPDFMDFREQVAAFADLGGARPGSRVLTGTGEPARIAVAEVTADLFDLWRTPPALGRGFRPGEDRPGGEAVAVLSHGAWTRRFGGDPEVVGEAIRLDGVPTTIVGVMGPEIELGDLARFELWVPLAAERGAAPRDRRDIWAMGRFRPGVTFEQARAEVAAVAERLAAEHPETNGGWSTTVRPFDRDLAGPGFWTVLTMLGITVVLVMLLACANVATLMLARASARGRELAVRAALGAGRLRVVRQLLTESALLSLAAGGLGLVLARGMLTGLSRLSAASGATDLFGTLTIDRDVLAFTLGVSLLAPLLFGLLPALTASRRDAGAVLKGGAGGGGAGRGALRGRRLLVATQVSLALMLMAVAGLLLRTMAAAWSMDLGYDAATILTLRLDLPERRYPDAERRRAFFRRVMEGARALPEVAEAAWVSHRPLGDGADVRSFTVDGRPPESPDRRPWAAVLAADEAYFEVLDLAVLRGRGIRPSDTADAPPVAVINGEAAERFWPGEDPVGQRLRLGGEGPWIEVAGLVESLRVPDPENPVFPTLYLPWEQSPRTGLAMLVRSRTEPLAAAPPIRRRVWALDPEQPVSSVRTLARIYREDLAGGGILVALFATFAAFALAMAAAGLYGVLSFAVHQRTRELGIRMALGARVETVRGMVLRQSAGMVALGAAAGLVGGLALGRILAGGLDGVDAFDPLTWALVLAALGLAAAVASLVPAWRATRVDPITALKAD